MLSSCMSVPLQHPAVSLVLVMRTRVGDRREARQVVWVKAGRAAGRTSVRTGGGRWPNQAAPWEAPAWRSAMKVLMSIMGISFRR